MSYGKLINGEIAYAPYHIVKDGADILGYNYDGNSAMLLADGYKPVEVVAYPSDGKEYVQYISEVADKIIDGWQPKPPLTDDEISAKRYKLYSECSDRAFASYNQGGGTTLKQAIVQKAQIQFENKKSDQTNMTMRDFLHKVTAEYTLAHKHSVSNADLSYKYQESNGIDQIDIGSETINLVRTTVSSTIQLPKISKVQTVKVDNTSEDTVEILPFSGDFVDGLSSALTVSGKSSIEIIADVKSNSWDIYKPALEQEPMGFRLSDLFGNEAVDVTDVEVGMGIRLSQPSTGKAKLELDLASLGIVLNSR